MEIKIWGTCADGTYKRKRRTVEDFAELKAIGKTIIEVITVFIVKYVI